MNNTKKGFTLVELLVVIAILAILATVSVVGYTSFIDRAKDSNASTELNLITRQIDAAAMTEGYVVYTVDANGAATTTVSFTLYKNATGYYTDNTFKTAIVDTNVTALAAYLTSQSDFSQVGTFTASGTKITFASAKTAGGAAVWTLK